LIPAANEARATATASIRSLLPRSRLERRVPAINRVETRTTRSPRAITNRSSAPETCRQILQRPHPLPIETARPDHQRREPAGTDRDRRIAEHLAGRCVDDGDGVRALGGCPPRARSWRSSTSFHVPMLDARRTGLARGAATLLSSHAEHPRPATSDTTKGSQATPADSLKESQLAARSASDDTDDRIETASLKAAARLPGCPAHALVVRSGSHGEPPRVFARASHAASPLLSLGCALHRSDWFPG
jgi:hypothetical protein